MCTMNVSLECPMKQKDDEDASQATTFEEEEDKFSLSLSIFTSFFLSFLWTKFICTETAQRFSCKKKKSLLFSADYIISSKILLLLPPHHITLLFYSKLIHNKMTHPYHIRSSVMTTRSGFSKQPSLPTYTIILSTSKKQQRVWWWLCHYECTRPIHIKAKRKKNLTPT